MLLYPEDTADIVFVLSCGSDHIAWPGFGKEFSKVIVHESNPAYEDKHSVLQVMPIPIRKLGRHIRGLGNIEEKDCVVFWDDERLDVMTA